MRSEAALDRERDGLAAAQAERRDSASQTAILQRIEQRRQHARARGAERVSQRDGAAIDVDLVPVPPFGARA